MPRPRPTPQHLAQALMAGNRVALAQAITLAESRLAQDQPQIEALFSALAQPPGQTLRIGITGPPGAGKSTLIEQLGLPVANKANPLAVLTVDPSSTQSGGSILGDKTRMEQLSRHAHAFVRPAPSQGHLGGGAPATHASIALCEAAGYQTVFVETVGVGQSETEVSQYTDIVWLVLPPASGDSLQGIKRGIVEAADIVVINKADGSLLAAATETRLQYEFGLAHYPAKAGRIGHVPVMAVSAETGAGLDTLWQLTQQIAEEAHASGYFHNQRKQQYQQWAMQLLEQAWLQRLRNHPQLSQVNGTVGQLGHFPWPGVLVEAMVDNLIGSGKWKMENGK